MADPTAMVDNSWRTPQFRQKVVAQIQETMRMCGKQPSKSPIDMESHVFSRANSKEEYLKLVAKLLIHVRELNKDKGQHLNMIGQHPGATQIGNMGQPQGPGGMQADPINALQVMTKGQMTQNMGGGGPQVMGGGMAQTNAAMMAGGQTMTTTMGGQQMAPGQMMNQQIGGAQMPPNQMGGPGQGGQPQMYQQQMGNGARMQGQRPPFVSYQTPQQQMQARGMGPGMVRQQPPNMKPAEKLLQPMQPGGSRQVQPNMGQPRQPIVSQAGLIQPGGSGSPAPPGLPQYQQGFPGMPNQPQMNPNMPGMGPDMRQPVRASVPFTGAPTSTSMSGGQQPGLQHVPSPLSSTMMTSSAQSPPGFHSPSMGPGTVAPSPMGAGRGRPMGSVGVPSPSLMNLNTPGNPSSVGPVPSPASQLQPGVNSMPDDEKQYLEKHKQLQKYIEPLKRMIARTEKDDEKKKESIKMKNLLDILSDSSKRVPIKTLMKCAEVLQKLDSDYQKSQPSSADSGPKHKPGQHMCQPLLDAVAAQMNNPMFNHTLHRTFGKAVASLHGLPISVPSAPPAKKSRQNEDESEGIPDIVQGEVARLQPRFKVKLDPMYHTGSKTIHIICNIDDEKLPSVPSINITIPENYPETSPTCDTCSHDYESTPFLQRVQKNLTAQVLVMPDKYSISALLDTWELSIRKSCGPVTS